MNISHARSAVAGAVVAFALWGSVAMSAAPVQETAAPADVVATVPVVMDVPAPVPTVDVAPVSVAPTDVAPADAAPADVAPAEVLPVAVEAPAVPVSAPIADVSEVSAGTPADCGDGFAMAEDGSCVPSDYWDEAPADCGDGFALAEDGSCVPANYWDAPVVELPACESEESTECFWDAETRGNGEGRSFVNVGGVTYLLGS